MPLQSNDISAIERRLREPATYPIKLMPCDSAALPAPARGGMIWLTDLVTIGVSDGTDWFPVTLGAAL